MVAIPLQLSKKGENRAASWDGLLGGGGEGGAGATAAGVG